MTDIKVSALPAATAIADVDQLMVIQGGISKRAPASLLKGVKGDAGVGLLNKGTWVAATYQPGDYVFSDGSVSATSMWVLNSLVAYASSTLPKNDATKWSELTAPAGQDGKSVELQKTATAIQWRQVGGTYADLVLLSALKGDPGLIGPIGSKWLTGTVVPAAGTGADGDFYLRSNGDYYGPKTTGAWGAIVASLKGSAGGSPLPVGGTAGQVLTKASTTDGDATWQTPAAGGGGGFINGNFMVPNQGVISWNIAAKASGFGAVYLAALGSNPCTQFVFNTDGTPTIFPTLPGGAGVLTGVLTGSTGAAGKISLSVANGKVYLENRMGWAVSITLFMSIAGTPV